MDSERILRIASEYKNGLSIKRIAERYEISTERVRRLIKIVTGEYPNGKSRT